MRVITLLTILFFSSHVKSFETNNANINRFWATFSSMDLKNLKKFYEDKVILLPRSMLRSKYYGIDKGAKGSKIFSNHDILKAYRNLSKVAPKKEWAHLFSKAYTNYKLTTVKDSDRDIKAYIRPQSVYRTKVLKIFNFLKFFIQNLTISDKDLVLKVYRTDKLVRQRLIFVFDYKTKKIKAQTILIGLLDADYFKNNPYAM